jgi:hypothetical protein
VSKVDHADKVGFPPLNQTIDRFVQEAVRRNLPLTFINIPSGEHGLDNLEDSITSRGIIEQTLRFMKEHLCEQ